MGATKFIAEKILQAKSRTSEPLLCAVRFGNLINSRGRVLGIWRGQIERGEVCTLTNPDATRFIMTVEQAMDLVMNVFDLGGQGETAIYPAKACTVRELFMAACGNEHLYKITSLRPGEKLHEYLTETLSSDKVERLTIDEIKQML
jgi:UDP-glucose 4-epimerase